GEAMMQRTPQAGPDGQGRHPRAGRWPGIPPSPPRRDPLHHLRAPHTCDGSSERMRAVVFTGTGDASILRVVDVPARDPGPGEVRIRVTSAGLNRADANYRAGKYLLRTPGESRSGFEGAGIVDAVGAGAPFAVGDRVGVLPSSFDVVHEGAAAESMTVPAAALVRSTAPASG